MRLLTDRKGRPLTGINSFGESVNYSATRFRADNSLALIAVYDTGKGTDTAALCINLAAYGYYPMPSHTFINSTCKAVIQPMINQECLRVEGTVEYGTFNTIALDVMILMSDIEHLADDNGGE
jgi:hypothetical protein